jgi:hypothetical protein
MASPSGPAAIEPVGVYGCIVAVSREIAQTGIAKSRNNAQQGYKFRGIDDVYNALAPLLAKHGLVILPRMLSRSVVEHASRSGGVLFYVTVEAEFDFVCAADGSTHTVKMYGEAMDSGDKATNKAASAAYKYAALQTFCIPTEGDNDADAMTPEPVIQLREAPAPTRVREKPAAATVGDRGTSREPGEDDELPAGALLVTSVELTATKNPSVKKALINFSDGKVRSTINTPLINTAEQCLAQRLPVWVTDKTTKWGVDLVKLSREGSVDMHGRA